MKNQGRKKAEGPLWPATSLPASTPPRASAIRMKPAWRDGGRSINYRGTWGQFSRTRVFQAGGAKVNRARGSPETRG